MEGMRQPYPTSRCAMLGAVIAVCLATHRPDPDLLARQLASLETQQDADWALTRFDDAEGLGAWRAFERCYAAVGPDASLLAPCDQDDVWRPDKLARLRAAMAPGVTLAFCDLRIVDAHGAVRSTTYWRGRRPTWDDLGELLATNVVTGAACLVRRDVLDVALPFPAELDDSFHDHWLACCALALGELRSVPEALVDYVQHDANVTGWSQAPGASTPKAAWRARAARDRERHIERPALWARTLLERVPGVSGAKRAALERAARPRLGRLVLDAVGEQRDPSRTLQARRRALRGYVMGRGSSRGLRAPATPRP
jgi:hypothetical protein